MPPQIVPPGQVDYFEVRIIETQLSQEKLVPLP